MVIVASVTFSNSFGVFLFAMIITERRTPDMLGKCSTLCTNNFFIAGVSSQQRWKEDAFFPCTLHLPHMGCLPPLPVPSTRVHLLQMVTTLVHHYPPKSGVPISVHFSALHLMSLGKYILMCIYIVVSYMYIEQFHCLR